MIRATWHVKDIDGNILRRSEAPHLYKLLEFPNSFMAWSTFLNYESKDLLSRGNAFIEIEGNSSNIQFHRLIPGQMTLVADPKKYVDHYEYNVNGKTIKFSAKEVIFMRLADPMMRI